MAMAQAVRDTTEVTEMQSLQLVKSLLRIALYNISYIRGLFPEKYYQDKYVPALEMKIKKLVPLDDESRRLVDWMEKGVYDALQRKYLKTMVFAICESDGATLLEEYSCAYFAESNICVPCDLQVSFSYDAESGGCNMELKAAGKICKELQPGSGVTAMQMKAAACKMIRTLAQLMRTLDNVPEERTLVVKLFYYEEITPEDYEPPFFRSCGEDELLTWAETPLKMKVGDVNAKHFSLALKVRSTLDPVPDDAEGSQSNAASEGDSTDSETEGTAPSHDAADKPLLTAVNSRDASQGTSEMKAWILSRDGAAFDTMDAFGRFPTVSLSIIEEMLESFVAESFLQKIADDTYQEAARKEDFSAKDADNSMLHEKLGAAAIASPVTLYPGDAHQSIGEYEEALYHALQMEYVSVKGLATKLGAGVSEKRVIEIIDRMVADGFLAKKAIPRNKGRKVLQNDASRRRFLDISKRFKSHPHANQDSRSALRRLPGEDIASRDGVDASGLGSEATEATQSATPTATKGNNKRSFPVAEDPCQERVANTAAPGCSSSKGLMQAGGIHLKSTQDIGLPTQKNQKTSLTVDPIYQSKKMRPEP